MSPCAAALPTRGGLRKQRVARFSISFPEDISWQAPVAVRALAVAPVAAAVAVVSPRHAPPVVAVAERGAAAAAVVVGVRHALPVVVAAAGEQGVAVRARPPDAVAWASAALRVPQASPSATALPGAAAGQYSLAACSR
jgi:hypothetical protein